MFPSYWEGRCSHSLPVGILSLGTSENRYIHAAVTRDTLVRHSNDTSSKGMNGLPGLGRRPGVHTAECLQGLGIHISTQRGENGGSRRLQEVAGLSGGERRLASNQTRSALRLHKGSLCPSLGERLMGGGSPRSGGQTEGLWRLKRQTSPGHWPPSHPALRGKARGPCLVLPSAASLTGPPRQEPPGHHPFSSCVLHTDRPHSAALSRPCLSPLVHSELRPDCRAAGDLPQGPRRPPRGLSSASTSAYGQAARKTGTAWETPTDRSVHHLLPRGRFLECGLRGRP